MKKCKKKVKMFTIFQVYVRSTNYERTLMSAECVCAGLFPVNASYPDLSEVLNHWQPVPIQTVPSAEDKVSGKQKLEYLDMNILVKLCQCEMWVYNKKEQKEKQKSPVIVF